MEQNTSTLPSFKSLIEKIHPDLEQLEEIRCQRRRKMFYILLAVVACVLIGWGIRMLFPVAEGFHIPFIVGGVIAIIIVSWRVNKYSSEIAHEYKKNIVTPFVRELIEEGSFNPYDGISEKDFICSNLFMRPDRYSSEDLITGKVGETKIAFSEVHAEEEYTTTDSKGRTQKNWRDIFRGFIFVSDFSKDFKTPLQIKRRKFFSSKKNRVHLEDPEFEKCFNVYCADQIEARYILTPSMMRRIMELEDKFRGRNMMISFHDAQVLIAVVDNTNHFEAGIWRSVFNTNKLQQEYAIIRSFSDIVENLNLNLRIWSKQV